MADTERYRETKEPLVKEAKVRLRGLKLKEALEVLAERKFDTVLISPQPSVAEVIAGFVLEKCSFLVPNTRENVDVVVSGGERVSSDLRTNALPLFDPTWNNPVLLRTAVKRFTFSPKEKIWLSRLADHTQFYRPSKPQEELLPRNVILARRRVSLPVHELITTALLSGMSAIESYKHGTEFLDHLWLHREKFGYPTSTVELTIPVIKNSKEIDELDYATFTFNKDRLTLLAGQKFLIVVGGSENSGKSTFSASLYKAMEGLIDQCTQKGILLYPLNITLCDLDLASPTSSFILGWAKEPRSKRKWTDSLIDEAIFDRNLAVENNNIVIADLPGGVPDRITRELAQGAHFSILMDKDFVRTGQWNDFLSDRHMPTLIAGIHTRFNEPGRFSCLRDYESQSLKEGNKYNFISGRVVDLDRQLKDDDVMIQFVAHALLFDYLPRKVVERAIYIRRLLADLGF